MVKQEKTWEAIHKLWDSLPDYNANVSASLAKIARESKGKSGARRVTGTSEINPKFKEQDFEAIADIIMTNKLES